MPDSSNHWPAAVLTADGGAWALRAKSTPDGIRATLERIRPDGQIAFAVPAAAAAWGAGSTTTVRLFAEPDRVIALTVATRRLVWQAVGLDGSPLGTSDIPMPDDRFDIRAARLNADRGLTVVAEGEILCSVGCNPFHQSFLRITTDGTLAWHHDTYYVDWPAMPMPDGGVLVASANPAVDAPPLLQRFDPQGQAQVPIPLVGMQPNAYPTALSGPVDGRWLLLAWSYDDDAYALWSIDADGHVGASRFDAQESPQAFGRGGFLVPMATPTGPRMQVLDGITLQARITLPFGSGGSDDGFDYGPWYWRMLDDGCVYGTWLSPIYRLGLARYAMPWEVPQDRLFRNGFD